MATDYSPGIHDLHSMQDVLNGIGNPDPYLRAIAEAGFTHVHWCHHWYGDFMYNAHEIAHIGRLLNQYNLKLADVHASEGHERFWYSPQEYARLGGVELVKNRIDFCEQLGGDAIVMHAYPLPADAAMADMIWGQLRKSLDALQPYALERGVKIAIENLVDFQSVKFEKKPYAEVGDNWDLIGRLFETYSADFLGLCYDSGHANLGRDRSAGLEKYLDRLTVLHLNSNDGSADQHHNLFADDLNWDQLARWIAAAPYDKPLSFETYHSGVDPDEATFLQNAHATATRFAVLVHKYVNT